jgi:integrase
MSQARVLTERELRKVMLYCAAHPHAARNKCMLLMTHHAGLRVGEVAALRLADVVAGDGVIRAEVHLSRDQTKGNVGRTVLLPQKLRDELLAYLRARFGNKDLIAVCYSNELGGRLVIGEMPPRLENLAQAGVHALNGIGGVNHPAHLGREGKERNHLVPDPAPGGGHSGEFLAPRAALKRIEFCQGGLGTGGGIDRLDGRSQGLAILPIGIVQAVAYQMHDAGLQRGLGVHHLQGFAHAFEAVCDRNEDIVAATGLHVVEDFHPELGTLGVFDPDACYSNAQRALFPTQKNPTRGFSANTLCQHFSQLYARAGVEGASSHSGRRFFISALADKGVAMHILMALAGHKNLSTTQRYISLNPNLMRAAVELI